MTDALEPLFQLADEAVASSSDQPQSPDFPIPTTTTTTNAEEDESLLIFDTTGLQLMELRGDDAGDDKSSSNKGMMGWFAKKDMDIPAGSVLLVAKPLAMVMDWEDDDIDDDDDIDEEEDFMLSDKGEIASKRNGILLLRLLQKIKHSPSIWSQQLSTLYPRTNQEIQSLSPILVTCEDPSINLQIQHLLTELETSLDIKELQTRLPLILRYNILSIETSPELFIHPSPSSGGHINLSGTGLYHLPSYFNHDSKPNVVRWTIGDVMFFVTNQLVKRGSELCISYIESDVLCEDKEIRSQLLNMDFKDGGDDDKDEEEEEEEDDDDEVPEFAPIIDVEVQQEIMSMHPLERLHEINDLLQQATSATTSSTNKQQQQQQQNDNDNNNKKNDEDNDEDDDDDDEDEEAIDAESWFKCDAHNLRILLAMTLESLGQNTKALEQWEECIAFTDQFLPPGDENGIALRVQATLCALTLQKESVAKQHAKHALQIHSMIFGGGLTRFKRRYTKEVEFLLVSRSSTTLNMETVMDLLFS